MAQMFINGEWTDAYTGETMPVVNPANGHELDTVPLARADDVEGAVRAAQVAFPG